jgi:uncharacterized protein YceK
MAGGPLRLSAAVSSLLVCAGCGTFWNIDRSGYGFPSGRCAHRVYGGVKIDLDLARRNLQDAFDSEGEPVSQCAFAAMMLVDVPLSAVGDTITLPFTLTHSWRLSTPRAEIDCQSQPVVLGFPETADQADR